MKKTFAVLLVFMFSCLLIGCQSKEKKGVPERIVDEVVDKHLKNVAYIDYSYEVKHNVDTTTHTDDMEIDLTIVYEFFTETQHYSTRYTYNRSDDLWDLDEDEKWFSHAWVTVNVEANEKALKGEWRVSFDDGEGFITISEVANGKAKLSYSLYLTAYYQHPFFIVRSDPVKTEIHGSGTCDVEHTADGISIRIPYSVEKPFYILKSGSGSAIESATYRRAYDDEFSLTFYPYKQKERIDMKAVYHEN